MRIAIIFTYPIYHGLQPIEEWMAESEPTF